MSATEILDEFKRLPFEQQCEVARRIADELQENLPPYLQAEFEHRAAALRENPDAGSDWQEIKAQIQSRLQASS